MFSFERTILSIFLILGSLAASAGSLGPGGTGGGDARAVQVTGFPNQEMLTSAISILKTQLDKTNYTPAFRESFRKEIDDLVSKKRFMYVPEVSSLGYRRFPGDYSSLMAMGAFTPFIAGEPIYFSKPVVDYNAERLAKVIAEEIPHHVLPGSLRFDENFVNKLGVSIAEGKTDSKLSETLESAFGLKQSQTVCRGKVWKDDYKNGERNPIQTSTEVELRFYFDLSKVSNFKTWSGSPGINIKATVEERVFEEGTKPEEINPIVHKNITLKTMAQLSGTYVAYGLNPSLGLPQKGTYGQDDSAGYFSTREKGSSAFNNRKGYDYTPLTGSDYRYLVAECASQPQLPVSK